MYEEEDYQEGAEIKKYVIQITQMSLFIKEITHSFPSSLYIFRLEYFHAPKENPQRQGEEYKKNVLKNNEI